MAVVTTMCFGTQRKAQTETIDMFWHFPTLKEGW